MEECLHCMDTLWYNCITGPELRRERMGMMDMEKTCGGCTDCGGCSGCGGSLTLTGEEIGVLKLLGAYAFLPVARRADTMEPFCYEEEMPKEASLVLELLEKKGLVELSYDKPLKGFHYRGYEKLPVKGSVGLTLRGQQVLELLELQGVQD